jgi:hypothetical protein
MSEQKQKFTYEVRKFMQKAKKKGRGGDTDIVHVNEQEKRLLKAAGGSGTVNPATGLREYKYGGNVSEGGKKQGAADAGGQGPNAGGGTGNGGNQGGMSPGLLDSKYPGAKGRKNRQYEGSLKNFAKVGSILGSLALGPAATAAKLGIDALSGDLSVEGMLDPFSGRMPDVPSTGAGYADSGRKDDNVTGLTAARKKKTTKQTRPLGSVGTILGSVGGSIRAGGL